MILITGATGLVGSHLLRKLSKTNANIIALYNNTQPSNELKNLATWLPVDILDVVALEQALKGVQQVYHCAAMVSFNAKDKQKMAAQNIDGTANVVNVCLENGIKKLVHVSSVAALGRTGNLPINETMPFDIDSQNSVYGKTKHLAEVEVWRGIAEGLDAVIINPTIILGAANWDSGSTKIFKSIYNKFPWFTNGANGFVDVADVATIMIALMESNITAQKFIVNAHNIGYKKLFDAIAIAFKVPLPHKKVTPLLAAIIWRVEVVKSFITNSNPLLTKETAHTAQATICYDNSKILGALPNFKFTNFEESIKRICKELTINYNLA
jgi:dihydroflavonol-4-reductase